jgi:hypothetical protein
MARRSSLGDVGAEVGDSAALFARPRTPRIAVPEETALPEQIVAPPAPVSPPPQTKIEDLSPSRIVAKSPKVEKKTIGIRLTANAADKLSEIERSLRRGGLSAHQSSASEIFITLLESVDIADLRERLTKRLTKTR